MCNTVFNGVRQIGRQVKFRPSVIGLKIDSAAQFSRLPTSHSPTVNISSPPIRPTHLRLMLCYEPVQHSFSAALSVGLHIQWRRRIRLCIIMYSVKGAGCSRFVVAYVMKHFRPDEVICG